ncbi:MAG: hypothetical protein H6624_04185 [Bdellovibrionaceae bacterium]|nr:hypothetical protein [Bdellovibrionales bacterium]MCB9083514.1 hypothetical protein [Pseudobdellovibrionaceae bacterium]
MEKTTKVRLAYTLPLQIWFDSVTMGGPLISDFHLTFHLLGIPSPQSGWVYPRPSLEALAQNEAVKLAGKRGENGPYEFLQNVWGDINKTKLGPCLEAISLSWNQGYRCLFLP